MVKVNIDDIRDLTDFINRVETGETIVIVKGDKPVAEIKPITTVLEEPRPFGLCAGEFIVPDDFDSPLPESIIREFMGQ